MNSKIEPNIHLAARVGPILFAFCAILLIQKPAGASLPGSVIVWGDTSFVASGGGGVAPFTDIVSAATGNGQTVICRKDGSVWAWGSNDSGQLGNGTKQDSSTPVQVLGIGGVGYLSNVVQVAAGYYYCLALLEDGSVVSWGRFSFGELGQTGSSDSEVPNRVQGPGGVGYLTGIGSIGAGYATSMALRADGTLLAWGNAGYGVLGNGQAERISTPIPAPVVGPNGQGMLEGIVSFSINSDNGNAVLSDGTMWTWGDNAYGQLGDGTTNPSSTPVEVLAPDGQGPLTGVAESGAGFFHSMALLKDGTLWSWGLNNLGALGDGTTVDRHLPVQVVGPAQRDHLTGVWHIAAGYQRSAALMLDGSVFDWGDSQLGDGAGQSSVPVQVESPNGSGPLGGICEIVPGYTATSAIMTPLPVIMGFDPTSGPVGQSVTLQGFNFSQITSTSFGGAPATFTVERDDAIMTDVPTRARTGPIELTNAAGKTDSATSFVVTEPDLISVSLPSDTVVGGSPIALSVNLSGASANGVSVSLSTDSPTATIEPSVTVAAGQSSAQVQVQTSGVTAAASVNIVAKLGSISKSVSLEVVPASLKTLTFVPSSVQGGAPSTGTLTLDGPGPPGGAYATLTSADSSVSVPAKIQVPANSSQVTFQVTTLAVTSDSNVTVHANYYGTSVDGTLKLTAPQLRGVSLYPSTVLGGGPVTASVTLTEGAPPGLTLTIAHPSWMDAPSQVAVPAGASEIHFEIRTHPVSSTETGNVSVSLGSSVQSSQLSVTAYAYPVGVSMVSLPYETGASDAARLFGIPVQLSGAAPIAAYDPVSNKYLIYPNMPSQNGVLPGQGYWVQESSPKPATGFDGFVPSPFSSQLSPGWNLVGDPFTDPVSVDALSFAAGADAGGSAPTASMLWSAAVQSGLVDGTIWTWDGSAHAYVAATVLRPYIGYWIYVYPSVSGGSPVSITYVDPPS